MKTVESARDVLLLGLASGERFLREAVADVTEAEYHWEPLLPFERAADLLLPPKQKKVWRVYKKDETWVYDYTPETLSPPPFTTIAWIMNHAAQTADMYFYCIETGKPEGIDRSWNDLLVPYDFWQMRNYLFDTLILVRDYLLSIPDERVHAELNKLTPAPWGEMRPVYLNVWGGIIEHAIQHAAQIAARKDRIRYGH